MFTNRLQANNFYADVLLAAEVKGPKMVDAIWRELCLKDLWFLLTVALGRSEMNGRDGIENPDWLYDRCVDVQYNPDGCIDLWAREHYKSTIITYAKSIQDILKNPNVTIGIFSVKRELAQDFLKQIKEEFENNIALKRIFPDILYEAPEKQSSCWGLEKGIRVKRERNSREETVEAWGLINGMPTGKHFDILVFDDVVTEQSVTNHEQLTKAFTMLRLALNLGAHGGSRRLIGTYYHFNDAWRQAVNNKIAVERVHPATEDGKAKGKPVLLTAAALAKKRSDMGPYIFACQMLLNPKADSVQGFERAWVRPWTPKPEYWGRMNIYIVVDPASAKKQKATGHDYTVIWVIGLGEDGRYYLIDGVRDRMNLTQRTDKLIYFVRTYKPIAVGYEEYGMQADIEHIEFVQDLQNFHFEIIPLGGSMKKEDRILKLVPLFERARFFTPGYLTIRDRDDAFRDIMKEFLEEEFMAFPVCTHDDMLDSLSRILTKELNAVFPDSDEYVKLRGGYPNSSGTSISAGVDIDPLENA